VTTLVDLDVSIRAPARRATLSDMVQAMAEGFDPDGATARTRLGQGCTAALVYPPVKGGTPSIRSVRQSAAESITIGRKNLLDEAAAGA
jgi:hypothetical protein